MNYTQAYKELRNRGVNANKARMLLDTSAETGIDTLGEFTVIFDGDGFTVTERVHRNREGMKMTLVNITLDEDEQAFLLVLGDNNPRKIALVSVAEKIRRARDDTPWTVRDVKPPTTEDGNSRLAAMRAIGQDRHPGYPVHTGMQSHSGYAEHSHEVRPDHLGVKRSEGS